MDSSEYSLDVCVKCTTPPECDRTVGVAAIVLKTITNFGNISHQFGQSAEDSFGQTEDINANADTIDEAVEEFRSRDCFYSNEQLAAIIREASFSFE
jgi:hypothetical protein